MIDREQRRNWRRQLALVTVAIAVANVLASIVVPKGTLWRLGAFTFPAQSVFKPLLLLNGAFLLFLCIGGKRLRNASLDEPAATPDRHSTAFWILLSIAVIGLYLPVLGVNIADHDWTHRHISAGLTSAGAVGRLFIKPQPDGMYRPLAFLSFLLDYRIFAERLWGYHLQSIAIHALNAVLVGLLAIRLGLPRSVARTAAALFGVSAIHFEAILWPAARFDPLAAMFSLLCLILFHAYWTGAGRSIAYGALSLLCFVLGVLTKETAYSLVLLVPAIVFSRSCWHMERAQLRNAAAFIAVLVGCGVILISFRFMLFGSIGGYGYSTGRPSLAGVSLQSGYLLVDRSLLLGQFGINCAVPLGHAGAIIVATYSALILAFALASNGPFTRQMWMLLGLTIASAIPAITVIGWVQPSLQHCRYLYWPSVWLSLLLALALQRTSRPIALGCGMLIVQAAGLTYNIQVYRAAMSEIDGKARQISGRLSADATTSKALVIVGVPENVNGVLYYGPELEHRLRQALPGVSVTSCASLRECATQNLSGSYLYRWHPQSANLEIGQW
jgi:hypothetical protein